MFSAMSGTSERMSTMPACAMVFAGEICGGASALAATAIAASTNERRQAVRLFTGALPLEIQVLVVVAEIRIRVDLGHVQGVAGLRGEAQPCLGVTVVPMHEVFVTDAHHFAGQLRGFLR